MWETEPPSAICDDRVAAVIDSLDEPALLLDDGDSVIHLNQEAAEALAVDRDQVIGKTLTDDAEYRGVSCARVLAALERAKTFPADEHQIDLNVRGRDCIYFLKRALLRTSDDRSLGILVVLHEASKFREKSRAQDTTIVAAAQELNTPLTSLALAVGLLQREREKQNELIREITEDVDRLNHASADFLNVMREQPLPITLPERRVRSQDRLRCHCRKISRSNRAQADRIRDPCRRESASDRRSAEAIMGNSHSRR